MFKLMVTFLLASTLVTAVQAQTVKLSDDVGSTPTKFVSLNAETTGGTPIWSIKGPGVAGKDYIIFRTYNPAAPPGNFQLVFIGNIPGTYAVSIAVAKADLAAQATTIITVSNPEPIPIPPKPIPPVPPKPPIPPKPPTPPAPISDPGFRAAVIYDINHTRTWPQTQVPILSSAKIFGYMGQKAIKVNGQPEYRTLDISSDLSSESPLWQTVLTKYKSQAPCIVISDGKTGIVAPLPSNVDDTLKLLQKYGGP